MPPDHCPPTLGYCTNVHAGTTVAQIQANLERYAVDVKRRVSPDEPMGVGLWFPHSAGVELTESDDGSNLADFRGWLEQRGLFCFTLNGFPFGDFHRDVVKHAVYEPHWADPRRLDCTRRLATILAALLPEHLNHGSISTLPLGWPGSFCDSVERYESQAEAAAAQLMTLVLDLARLERETGQRITVDLEPEPGCVIDSAPGLVRFFEEHLLRQGSQQSPNEQRVRDHLGVCHDVCHSAVMFEPQAEALSTYQAAGLRIGKVQVSSAIQLNLDGMTGNERAHALEQLQRFAEDRYLHQTVIRQQDGMTRFYADLPDALERESHNPGGTWRVHFHVPVFAERLGAIDSTRPDIAECLNNLQPAHGDPVFEVETYAWDVLPPEVKAESSEGFDLSGGIAAELRWVSAQLRETLKSQVLGS